MTSRILTRSQPRGCYGWIRAEPGNPHTKGKNFCGKSKNNLREQRKRMRDAEEESSFLLSFLPICLLAAGRGGNHGNKLTIQRQIKP